MVRCLTTQLSFLQGALHLRDAYPPQPQLIEKLSPFLPQVQEASDLLGLLLTPQLSVKDSWKGSELLLAEAHQRDTVLKAAAKAIQEEATFNAWERAQMHNLETSLSEAAAALRAVQSAREKDRIWAGQKGVNRGVIGFMLTVVGILIQLLPWLASR